MNANSAMPAVAECTAENRQARLKAIAMLGSTASTPQSSSPCDGLSASFLGSGPHRAHMSKFPNL